MDIQLPQVKSLQENLKDLGLKEKSDALSENVKALNDNLRESTSKIEAPKIPKLKPRWPHDLPTRSCNGKFLHML